MIVQTGKIVFSKLGACPKCMRQSFNAALVALCSAMTAFLVFGWSHVVFLIIAAAAFLMMLWLAHLSAYAYRATMFAVASEGRKHNSRRRIVVSRLIKVFVGAAIATSIPIGLLRAQQGYYPTPGCRSCRVACRSGTRFMCCPEGRPFLNYCDCLCYQSNDFVCDRGYADCRGGEVCSYPNTQGMTSYYETFRCLQ